MFIPTLIKYKSVIQLGFDVTQMIEHWIFTDFGGGGGVKIFSNDTQFCRQFIARLSSLKLIDEAY